MASSGASLIPEEMPSAEEQSGVQDYRSSMVQENSRALNQMVLSEPDQQILLLTQENSRLKQELQEFERLVLLQNECLESIFVEKTRRVNELTLKIYDLKKEKENIVRIKIQENIHAQKCLEEANRKLSEMEEELKRYESNDEDEPAHLACILCGNTPEQVREAKKLWKERNRCTAQNLLEIIEEKKSERQCSMSVQGQLAVGQIPCKLFLINEKQLGLGPYREGVRKNSYTVKYSKFADTLSRKETFKERPLKFQEPDDLADAGFFYTGYGDCVRCFSCGIAFGHWKPGDDPWKEHARLSPCCTFMRETAGQLFISGVQLAFSQGEELLTGTEDQGADVTNTQDMQAGSLRQFQGAEGGIDPVNE